MTAAATDRDPAPLRLARPDGVVLAGDARGPGDGPGVLLLHGGGQTRHAWDDTAARLAADGWHAVTLDLRGHGESGRPADGRYAMADFLDDLHAALDAFPRPPAVVGASLGGMVALLAAGESEAARLSALVLVDIAPRTEDEGVRRIVGFMERHRAGFATLEEAADAVAAYLPHRRRPRSAEGLRRNLRRGEDGRWYWHWDPRLLEGLDHVLDEARFTAAAARLRVPTLLVRGRWSDVVSDAIVEEFLALAPHARRADVTDAGHMVAGDSNEAFADVILGFLREIAPER